MSASLLNKAKVRQYILDTTARLRPGWTCTRVSGEAVDRIEAKLRAMIRTQIQGHPTKGQTFRP
jgi:hypothetical protein